MHCRVRYLLNFDLKIRSGQVWGIIVWPQISSSYKDGRSYSFLLSFENLFSYSVFTLDNTSGSRSPRIHARSIIQVMRDRQIKRLAFEDFFSFILCAYFVFKDEVEYTINLIHFFFLLKLGLDLMIGLSTLPSRWILVVLDQANQHIITKLANNRMHSKNSQFWFNCMTEIASLW